MSLPFPSEVLHQHSAMLGKTGSGKSSKLRLIVEYLLDHGKRVVVVDPKGDWWGLKSGADGKSAGYPIVMFGNFVDQRASDVPLNEQSGAHVAELVASGNRPCVIGFRGWYTSHMVQFWIDFAAGLFAKNRGELYLVLDEAHNFAPKGKIQDIQAGKCLHWTNRLLSEGRGLGIVCLIASQRPQKVHNDTLTSAETLFALKMVHAADRRAVQDWIEGCGDLALGKEVLNSLAALKREDGYVWSPEINFGPKRVVFPMFKTFDSFAPPQLQKKVLTASWADVDLSAVKDKLAAVIEEAKANDPKELKAEIRTLRTEVQKLKAAKPPPTDTKPPEPVPVFTPEDRKLISETVTYTQESWEDMIKRMEEFSTKSAGIMDSLRRIESLSAQSRRAAVAQPAHSRKTTQAAATATAFRRPAPDYSHVNERDEIPNTPLPSQGVTLLGNPELKLLAVLHQYPDGMEVGKLALLSGRQYNGTMRNLLATLRTTGCITGDNTGILRITQIGESYGPFEDPPQGEELIEWWRHHKAFGNPEREIFDTLHAHPEGLTAEELAAATNRQYNGTMRNLLAKLRTAGVLVGKNTETMKLIPELYYE